MWNTGNIFTSKTRTKTSKPATKSAKAKKKKALKRHLYWCPLMFLVPGSAGTCESSLSPTEGGTCWIRSNSTEGKVVFCVGRLWWSSSEPTTWTPRFWLFQTVHRRRRHQPPLTSCPAAVKRWIKGSRRRVKRIHHDFSLSSLWSFLLSPVITLHNSHFNTGLPALARRRNLPRVMKTYIPGLASWAEIPLAAAASLIETLLNLCR